MFDCFGLSFYTLKLVFFMDRIDAKPARYGGRIDIYVIDEERSTKRKYLYDE